MINLLNFNDFHFTSILLIIPITPGLCWNTIFCILYLNFLDMKQENCMDISELVIRALIGYCHTFTTLKEMQITALETERERGDLITLYKLMNNLKKQV